MCWEFYEGFNTKKHIAYISMMGHFCTGMKVSSLHNQMKKQWLIQLNSIFFLWLDMYMNEFLDLQMSPNVRVGKAYKCSQMCTVKVLVHESF